MVVVGSGAVSGTDVVVGFDSVLTVVVVVSMEAIVVVELVGTDVVLDVLDVLEVDSLDVEEVLKVVVGSVLDGVELVKLCVDEGPPICITAAYLEGDTSAPSAAAMTSMVTKPGSSGVRALKAKAKAPPAGTVSGPAHVRVLLEIDGSVVNPPVTEAAMNRAPVGRMTLSDPSVRVVPVRFRTVTS